MKKEIIAFFDQEAQRYDSWKKRNRYYHNDLKRFFAFLVPEGSSILEVGCGTGDLLAHLHPKSNATLGIDISEKMIERAKENYPKLHFEVADIEGLAIDQLFDYVILSNVVGCLDNVRKAFSELHKVSHKKTRIIISYYNYAWEPLLKIATFLHLRKKQPQQLNWLSLEDIQNLLHLADFEVIKKGQRFLLPFYVPLISYFINRFIAPLPLFRHLCLTSFVIAKPTEHEMRYKHKYSVSVIIPARNEKGNIEDAVKRVPDMGLSTEIIFIEGHSKDGTLDEIKRVCDQYRDKRDMRYAVQDGKGKGDAVRKGFAMAKGDILMILDADLTVTPEDLPQFYDALSSGKGEFINGTRLVYQMEHQAMRFLNILGNRFFSILFTWILDQRFKDTLCGTKVLFRSDYEKICVNRKFFGDFDPFGDFDLIFGASKLNLKIVEVPIRYRERTYGSTNISRFKHGWLLLKMAIFAMKKIKFI